MNFKRALQTLGYNFRLNSKSRAEYCRKKHILGYVGNNVRLPAMILPIYPELLCLHNNIEVASGVRFVVHDAIHSVVNQDGNGALMRENIGKIEVFDNVFIGAGTTILPGVKIGPNAIIGAGSVVNKDIPENSVCVGVPAKQVGTYREYVAKHALKEEAEA